MEFALTPRLRSAIETVILRGGDAAVLAPCARDDARGISLEHVRLLSRLLREEEPRLQHVWVLPAPACAHRPDVVHAPPDSARSQVHELLEGAMPQLPAKPEKRAPHPELAPRMEQLRAAQATSPHPQPHLHPHPHPDQQLRAAQTRGYGLQPHVSRLLPCIPRLQPPVSRPAASIPR